MKLQLNFYSDKVIIRSIAASILADLAFFPVIAIIGARQVGKTTLI